MSCKYNYIKCTQYCSPHKCFKFAVPLSRFAAAWVHCMTQLEIYNRFPLSGISVIQPIAKLLHVVYVAFFCRVVKKNAAFVHTTVTVHNKFCSPIKNIHRMKGSSLCVLARFVLVGMKGFMFRRNCIMSSLSIVERECIWINSFAIRITIPRIVASKVRYTTHFKARYE